MFIVVMNNLMEIARTFTMEEIEDALDYMDLVNEDIPFEKDMWFCAKVYPFIRNDNNLYDDDDEEEMDIDFFG